MKVLAIGAAGKMGRAVVSYFATDPAVETLGVLDRPGSDLRSLAQGDETGRFRFHPLDIDSTEELREVMKGYDVGVSTLPNRRLSYQVMEAAIDARLDLVDILEEYHRRPDVYQTEGFIVPPECRDAWEYGERLHEKALRNDVLILDGMGFAPGLSNITSAHGIDLLDRADTVVARVGGIPNIECCAKHPLRYMTTWSLEHVLREYSIKTLIQKDGRPTEVHALYDEETFQFDELGLDEKLECAVTPGMPSFIHTHPELQYFAEKTVRWPGHYQGVRTLIECGLFDEQPVEIEGSADLAPQGPAGCHQPAAGAAGRRWGCVRDVQHGHGHQGRPASQGGIPYVGDGQPGILGHGPGDKLPGRHRRQTDRPGQDRTSKASAPRRSASATGTISGSWRSFWIGTSPSRKRSPPFWKRSCSRRRKILRRARRWIWDDSIRWGLQMIA